MPHKRKKLSELKPFKSWEAAGDLLGELLDEFTAKRINDLQMIGELNRMLFQIRLTAEDQRRKKR